jgi:hypothetical protein
VAAFTFSACIADNAFAFRWTSSIGAAHLGGGAVKAFGQVRYGSVQVVRSSDCSAGKARASAEFLLWFNSRAAKKATIGRSATEFSG